MATVFVARGSDPVRQAPVDELPGLLEDVQNRVWVDIAGPDDEGAERIVRDIFKFHPLAIEDCFGALEHPKAEAFDGYVYVVTHGLAEGSTAEEHETIELDAFVGKNYLVTYHAKPSSSVSAVQELVRRGSDLLRRGPSSLLHAILEEQVHRIEPVLDSIDEHIAELEERVITRPRSRDLAVLMALRRNILHLRRWLTKQRDVVMRLARNEFSLGTPSEAVPFRDVYDSLQRFTDLLENYRELSTSVQEAYLTVTSNRLNETMKYLTIFTAVLMPLTVITGVYGMNFEDMPELHWKVGYPLVLGTMAITAVLVLRFFRRKGWIGEGSDAAAPPHDRMKEP
jgi:magnesium transporter